MTKAIEAAKAAEPSLTSTVAALARHYLGGRRTLIVLAVAALAGAAFFNWGWLVALGIAPLLLMLAPCAAMCALGYCMKKKDAGASSKAASADTPPAKKDRDCCG